MSDIKLSREELNQINDLLDQIDCFSEDLKIQKIRDLTIDIRSILEPIYCPTCGACGEIGDGCASKCDSLSTLQLFLNLEQYLLEKERQFFKSEINRPNIISKIIDELRNRVNTSETGLYCDHYIKSYYELEKENNDFYVNVKRLLDLFDKVEESDSGKEFHPNTISSCRVLDGIEIEKTIKTLKELIK